MRVCLKSRSHTHALAVLGLAVLVAFAAPMRASASSGCDAVNAGWWNQTLAPNASTYSTSFNAGDVLQFHVASTASLNSSLSISAGRVYLVLTFDGVLPRPQSYTVPANSYPITLTNQGSSALGLMVTCTVSTSSAAQNAPKAYLSSRINGTLLNSPASTSLLYREQRRTERRGGAGAPAAGDNSAAVNGGVASGEASRFHDTSASNDDPNVAFRTSLSDMRHRFRDADMERGRMALGAGGGGSLPLVYETPAVWDVWMEGRYSGFNDDSGGLDRDGHVGLLFFGADYRVTPDMIVGALVQFDWAKDDSDVLQSEIEGNGWMAGPYLSARLNENTYLDLRAAWGTSTNDMTLGAATSNFDTWRWLVKGTLAGNWVYGSWRITPSAELAYVSENQDAFTNSFGTRIAAQTVSLGRLQFGPEIGYRFAHDGHTFIEPFAALKGEWDFDNPNVEIVDGVVVGPGDLWGRIEGGLNVSTAGGTVIRGQASWDGVGSSNYSGYTLQGIVNVPLN